MRRVRPERFHSIPKFIGKSFIQNYLYADLLTPPPQAACIPKVPDIFGEVAESSAVLRSPSITYPECDLYVDDGMMTMKTYAICTEIPILGHCHCNLLLPQNSKFPERANLALRRTLPRLSFP